jgi:hypothetical protein
MVKAVGYDDCVFCKLASGDPSQHRSEWFYLGIEGIIVEDLHSKGHKLRLLFVPGAHVACGKEGVQIRYEANQLLRAIGRALEVERDLIMGAMEMDDHKFRAHFHVQLVLDEN